MSKVASLAVVGEGQEQALLTAPNQQLEKHGDTNHTSDIQRNFIQISDSQGLIDSKHLDEMAWSDKNLHFSEQHLVYHLDKIVRDFKNQGEKFRLSPSQLQEHCHRFFAAAAKELMQESIVSLLVRRSHTRQGGSGYLRIQLDE